MVFITSRALVRWPPELIRAVPGISAYPRNLLVHWNIRHDYLMRRSPRVPRPPPRTTPTRFLSVIHTLSSRALSRCSLWYLGKQAYL